MRAVNTAPLHIGTTTTTAAAAAATGGPAAGGAATHRSGTAARSTPEHVRNMAEAVQSAVEQHASSKKTGKSAKFAASAELVALGLRTQRKANNKEMQSHTTGTAGSTGTNRPVYESSKSFSFTTSGFSSSLNDGGTPSPSAQLHESRNRKQHFAAKNATVTVAATASSNVAGPAPHPFFEVTKIQTSQRRRSQQPMLTTSSGTSGTTNTVSSGRTVSFMDMTNSSGDSPTADRKRKRRTSEDINSSWPASPANNIYQDNNRTTTTTTPKTFARSKTDVNPSVMQFSRSRTTVDFSRDLASEADNDEDDDEDDDENNKPEPYSAGEYEVEICDVYEASVTSSSVHEATTKETPPTTGPRAHHHAHGTEPDAMPSPSPTSSHDVVEDVVTTVLSPRRKRYIAEHDHEHVHRHTAAHVDCHRVHKPADIESVVTTIQEGQKRYCEAFEACKVPLLEFVPTSHVRAGVQLVDEIESLACTVRLAQAHYLASIVDEESEIIEAQRRINEKRRKKEMWHMELNDMQIRYAWKVEVHRRMQEHDAMQAAERESERVEAAAKLAAHLLQLNRAAMLKADKESKQYETHKRREARRLKIERNALQAADAFSAQLEEQYAAEQAEAKARAEHEAADRARLLKEQLKSNHMISTSGGTSLSLNADALSDESDDDFAEEEDQLDESDKDGVVAIIKVTLDKIRQSDLATRLGFNEHELTFTVYESLVAPKTGKFVRVICSQPRANRNSAFTLVHVLQRMATTTHTAVGSAAAAAAATHSTAPVPPLQLSTDSSSGDRLQHPTVESVHVPPVTGGAMSTDNSPRRNSLRGARVDTEGDTTVGAPAEAEKEEIQFQALVAHTGKWEKQMYVHKLVMCASAIADCALPVDLPMPSWNLKVFSRKLNKKAFHSYMRRLMTHLHLSFASPSLHAFWWHLGDVGMFANGAVVLCDYNTGRTIICRNTGDKLMSDGCNALCRALLAAAQMDTSGQRSDCYPTEEFIHTLTDGDDQCTAEDVSEVLSAAALRGIVRKLADDRHMSRTKSRHILRSPGLRRGQAVLCRYSIGLSKTVDASGATNNTSPSADKSLLAIRLQVHSSDPLSPSKNMAPTSMIQFAVPEPTRRSAILSYLRTEWFLNKLYDVHSKDCSLDTTNITTTESGYPPAVPNAGNTTTRTFDPSPRHRTTLADSSPRYTAGSSQPPPARKSVLDGITGPAINMYAALGYPSSAIELPVTTPLPREELHAAPSSSGGERGQATTFRAAALAVTSIGKRRGRHTNKSVDHAATDSGRKQLGVAGKQKQLGARHSLRGHSPGFDLEPVPKR